MLGHHEHTNNPRNATAVLGIAPSTASGCLICETASEDVERDLLSGVFLDVFDRVADGLDFLRRISSSINIAML